MSIWSIFLRYDERVPHNLGFAQSLFDFYNKPLSEKLFQAQKRSSVRSVKKGNCVIIGRNANSILKEFDHSLHVFVHAPTYYRLQHMKTLMPDTPGGKALRRAAGDRPQAPQILHLLHRHCVWHGKFLRRLPRHRKIRHRGLCGHYLRAGTEISRRNIISVQASCLPSESLHRFPLYTKTFCCPIFLYALPINTFFRRMQIHIYGSAFPVCPFPPAQKHTSFPRSAKRRFHSILQRFFLLRVLYLKFMIIPASCGFLGSSKTSYLPNPLSRFEVIT